MKKNIYLGHGMFFFVHRGAFLSFPKYFFWIEYQLFEKIVDVLPKLLVYPSAYPNRNSNPNPMERNRPTNVG